MNITYKNVEKLIPYINNPRQNDQAVDAVASSIKNFGFKVPIVIDSKNEIVNGHTRLKAAKKLGMEEVPAIVADDLTDEQIKAFRLADNKVGELAEWDEDALAIELEELGNLNFDMSEFGFEELDQLEEEQAEIVEDDFAGELPEEPKSRLGDIYQLGRHRLMCGDSTDEEQVAQLVENEAVDMVFTDPPYNANYSSRVDKSRRKPWGGILNDEMSKDDFDSFLIDINAMINLFLKEGGSVYECIDWKSYAQLSLVFSKAFNQKSMIVWNKNYFGLGTYYRTKHELIVFGCKGEQLNVWNAGHNEMDVWDIDREKTKNYEHPTQKPVEIPARAIRNSSNENERVLDLFGGSGSTIIACEQINRQGYIMELDPKYTDVIINRWENFTGKKAEKLN